jgi:hypothetical protein
VIRTPHRHDPLRLRSAMNSNWEGPYFFFWFIVCAVTSGEVASLTLCRICLRVMTISWRHPLRTMTHIVWDQQRLQLQYWPEYSFLLLVKHPLHWGVASLTLRRICLRAMTISWRHTLRHMTHFVWDQHDFNCSIVLFIVVIHRDSTCRILTLVLHPELLLPQFVSKVMTISGDATLFDIWPLRLRSSNDFNCSIVLYLFLWFIRIRLAVITASLVLFGEFLTLVLPQIKESLSFTHEKLLPSHRKMCLRVMKISWPLIDISPFVWDQHSSNWRKSLFILPSFGKAPLHWNVASLHYAESV